MGTGPSPGSIVFRRVAEPDSHQPLIGQVLSVDYFPFFSLSARKFGRAKAAR